MANTNQMTNILYWLIINSKLNIFMEVEYIYGYFQYNFMYIKFQIIFGFGIYKVDSNTWFKKIFFYVNKSETSNAVIFY